MAKKTARKTARKTAKKSAKGRTHGRGQGKTQISISLNMSLVDEIDILAEADHRNRSNMIATILEGHVKNIRAQS